MLSFIVGSVTEVNNNLEIMFDTNDCATI